MPDPEKTVAEKLRAISPEASSDFEWLRSVCTDANPANATLLWGYCLKVALDNPHWTFFEVIHEAHSRFKKSEIKII